MESRFEKIVHEVIEAVRLLVAALHRDIAKVEEDVEAVAEDADSEFSYLLEISNEIQFLSK